MLGAGRSSALAWSNVILNSPGLRMSATGIITCPTWLSCFLAQKPRATGAEDGSFDGSSHTQALDHPAKSSGCVAAVRCQSCSRGDDRRRHLIVLLLTSPNDPKEGGARMGPSG